MGIIKTGKIQSHGNFNELDDRITVLEDTYVRHLWFAEISSGASGTITPPTGGAIVLDQWAAGVDAVTSTLTTTRNPTLESVKEADGTIVTATLAVNGAWTISGTPSAYPIAILYVYEVKLVQSDRTKSLVEIEADQGLKITDSPTFAAVNATTFDTNVAAAGVTLTGTTLAADGTDANIDINLTPKGTGEVNIPKVDIDGGTITGITDLVVADGGTGASTLTDHGVLVGSGTDPVTALAVGTNGQVLVGSTGADPVFATITDGEGIDTTLGAGTLTIACETSTETNPGVVELDTVAEALAGTDTTRAMTSAGTAAALAVLCNPKAPSQGVNMTAAASGSTGIQVADNDNIDFGTGNFTLVWKGSLPDWTPSATTYLLNKLSGGGANYYGYQLYISTGGKIGVVLMRNDSGTAVESSVVTGLVDGTAHAIKAVVTRETASVAGSIIFYIDGVQLGSSGSITAAATVTIDSTGILHVLGSPTSGARYASRTHHAYTFNRALTAAEVLDLYRNGIAFADKWGSQTELMPNQVDRDFSGASAWADVDLVSGGGAYDETTDLTITAGAAGAGDYCTCPVASAPTTINKKYRMTYDLANIVGSWTLKSFDGTQTIGTISANATQGYLEWTASTTGGYRLVAVSNLASGDFDNFTLKEIGATLALEPEGIQPNPGQWLDSSSNKLHAWQPAAGSSLVRYKNTFEIRGQNTWAGTHEAQSIFWATDASKAILPVDCYITDIIGVITGATIEDIIIGDGSDTDRWVTITTGLATGTTAFTVANRISDGTNYEMVVDPDANFTGTIEWTIKGIILE